MKNPIEGMFKKKQEPRPEKKPEDQIANLEEKRKQILAWNDLTPADAEILNGIDNDIEDLKKAA